MNGSFKLVFLISKLFIIIQSNPKHPFMGNAPSLPNSFFQNTKINLQQWKEVRTITKTYYQNSVTEKCYQLHILPDTSLNREQIQQRVKILAENLPKIIQLGTYQQKIYLVAETTDEMLKQFLSKCKQNKLMILQLYQQALKMFNYLKLHYGCFFISQQMIKVSRTGKILGWFHKDYLKNKPEYPLPDQIGQQHMVWNINKIFDAYIHSQIQELKSDNFIQSISRCSNLINKINSIKSYQQSTYSDRNYGKTSLELNLKSSLYQVLPVSSQIQQIFSHEFQYNHNNGMISKRNSVQTKESTYVDQSKISQFKHAMTHQHTKSLLRIINNNSGQSIHSLQNIAETSSSAKLGLAIKQKCCSQSPNKDSFAISIDFQMQQGPLILSAQEKQDQEHSSTNLDQNKHIILNLSESDDNSFHQYKNIQIDKKELIQNFNNLLYGEAIQECNSPLRKQLQNDLRNIFSSELLY